MYLHHCVKILFNYIVYGSWWVALCAASLGMLTWFELTGMWWNTALFVFILGSTLVVYNLNMLSGLAELRRIGTHSERHHWCMNNELLMKATLAVGLILSAVSVCFLSSVVWLFMLPLAFVALAYTIPIVKRQTSKIRIREIGLWKIFIIAGVWSGMTVILPSVEYFGLDQLVEKLSWELAIERSIFILAITIPFDIRDLINDAKKSVRTIPSILGWKQSVVLAEVLLLAFISFVGLRIGIHHPFFLGYLISSIIAMIIVAFSNPQRNDMYCSFWVEGTMIVQFVLVLVLSRQLF